MQTTNRTNVFQFELFFLFALHACGEEAKIASNTSEIVPMLQPPVCKKLYDPLEPSVSLVIQNHDILETTFPLFKTLTKISETSGMDPVSPEIFLERLLEHGAFATQLHPLNDLTIDLYPVRHESDFSANPTSEYFDTNNSAKYLAPIGVFNRFDLRDPEGKHCGEYRIVYGNENQRMFIIFEGALPNPTPENPHRCRTIAEKWGRLPGMSNDKVGQFLQKFFYDGLLGFEPVVHFEHYGNPYGQVRTNMIGDQIWELREFRTSLTFTSTSVSSSFEQLPLSNVPLFELYSETWPNSSEQQIFESLEDNFQNVLRTSALFDIFAPELSGEPLTAHNTINGIQLRTPREFSDLRNLPSDFPILNPPVEVDDPTRIMEMPGVQKTKLSIGGVVATNNIALGTNDLSLVQTIGLNRLGAMTCAGCHEYSSGRVVGFDDQGAEIVWPHDLRFTHVREGSLSEALQNFFLPARYESLRNVICKEFETVPPTKISTGAELAVRPSINQLRAWERDMHARALRTHRPH